MRLVSRYVLLGFTRISRKHKITNCFYIVLKASFLPWLHLFVSDPKHALPTMLCTTAELFKANIKYTQAHTTLYSSLTNIIKMKVCPISGLYTGFGSCYQWMNWYLPEASSVSVFRSWCALRSERHSFLPWVR